MKPLKILRLMIVPFAFVVLIFIRFSEPWIRIRIGQWWTHRLGHLIGNTECYLSERDAGKQPKTLDIWYPVSGSCNKVIQKKYRKKLHTLPTWFGSILFMLNQIFAGWERHHVQPAQVDRDIYNLWEQYAPHIGFTSREEKRGQKLLRSLGIPEGAKWVCVFVRDFAYMKHHYPKMDFSYHDYRDSDISDCIPAALWLVDKGYYVVRMGEIIAKPFHVKHKKIIDYPLSGKQSAFADLYLGAKCTFAFGSNSGFLCIPQVFNRPTAIINCVPFEYISTFCNGLAIWKHHLKDGKRMKITEIGDAGQFQHSHLYAQAGITLENNSAQEIFDLVEQMANSLEGVISNSEDDIRQEKFQSMYPRSYVNGMPLHGKVKLRIGREFLKGYV